MQTENSGEEKILDVYAAISALSEDLGASGISKDGFNSQQKFKFRGIDQVYQNLNGLLTKHGLLMLPRVISRETTEHQSKAGGTLFRHVLQVEYDLISVGNGSKVTVSVIGEAMDSGDKGTNKAMSIAYKYAAFQVFCIPVSANEVDDADSDTHEVGRRTTTNVAAWLNPLKVQLLEKLIAEAGSDLTKVKAHYGVDSLAEISEEQFAQVKGICEERIAAAAAKAAPASNGAEGADSHASGVASTLLPGAKSIAGVQRSQGRGAGGSR
jgi:hypothetical protein